MLEILEDNFENYIDILGFPLSSRELTLFEQAQYSVIVVLGKSHHQNVSKKFQLKLNGATKSIKPTKEFHLLGPRSAISRNLAGDLPRCTDFLWISRLKSTTESGKKPPPASNLFQ
jgi:hypothetical protein